MDWKYLLRRKNTYIAYKLFSTIRRTRHRKWNKIVTETMARPDGAKVNKSTRKKRESFLPVHVFAILIKKLQVPCDRLFWFQNSVHWPMPMFYNHVQILISGDQVIHVVTVILHLFTINQFLHYLQYLHISSLRTINAQLFQFVKAQASSQVRICMSLFLWILSVLPVETVSVLASSCSHLWCGLLCCWGTCNSKRLLQDKRTRITQVET